MNDEKRTFSQIFTPPEGYYGQVCVCSAMSADCTCVENILTVFSGGKTNNTRAFDGKPSFFLMLDKRHLFLNDLGIINGLCQLSPLTNGIWDKIKVQHAKVAVMQFGRNPYETTSNNGKEDLIWRYVVCTGNWLKLTFTNNGLEFIVLHFEDVTENDLKIVYATQRQLVDGYEVLVHLKGIDLFCHRSNLTGECAGACADFNNNVIGGDSAVGDNTLQKVCV